VQYSEQHR